MEILLWFIIITYTIDITGRSIWVYEDDYPKRTKEMEVINLIINILIVIWTIHLL